MSARYRARSLLIHGLLKLLSWLPLRAAHALGAVFGWCAWLLPTRRRRIASTNLARCLPELENAARKRLLQQNLVETGKAMFELGALWTWPPERAFGLIVETLGLDELRAAVRRGNGVIAIAPHIGSWEAAGLLLSREFPITILYAPGRLGIDTLLRDARARAGARVVPAGRSGVATLARNLRAGQMAGILPDQDPGRVSGLFAPFFGIEAKTMTLVSRLAQRTGASPFLVWADRLPAGRGFVFNARAAPAEIGTQPLERSVAAMNAAIEALVRERPAQYLWSYKRFRTRPDGERNFYNR